MLGCCIIARAAIPAQQAFLPLWVSCPSLRRSSRRISTTAPESIYNIWPPGRYKWHACPGSHESNIFNRTRGRMSKHTNLTTYYLLSPSKGAMVPSLWTPLQREDLAPMPLVSPSAAGTEASSTGRYCCTRFQNIYIKFSWRF